MPHGHNRQSLVFEQNVTLSIASLAANSAVAATSIIDGNELQGRQLLALKANLDVNGKTADQGSLVVGFCIGNLTLAEIAEWHTADPQRHEDPGASENANRKVFPIWYIPRSMTDNIAKPDTVPLFEKVNGLPRWNVIEGDVLKWYAHNCDGITITAGAIEITASWLTRWLRD